MASKRHGREEREGESKCSAKIASRRKGMTNLQKRGRKKDGWIQSLSAFFYF